MDPFLTPVPLELRHVQVIVGAMVRVAHSDGCHDEELVLIREFCEACRAEVNGLTSFQELARQPFDAARAREVLDTPLLRETCLKSCALLAYADGTLSDKEKEALAAVARDIGMTAEEAARAGELVRDHLLRQMARLQNVEGLKKVADELGR